MECQHLSMGGVGQRCGTFDDKHILFGGLFIPCVQNILSHFPFFKELNECLAAELSLMHSRMNGDIKHTQFSQEKDVYQLEVKPDILDSFMIFIVILSLACAF